MTKIYVGTKQVIASPMPRGEYNEYRGWPLPADENGDDAGFLVEYVDGGKANDSRHAGYISWSPADVFEKAYRPIGTVQDRVRVEHDELDTKIRALVRFLGSLACRALTAEAQDLLWQQSVLMTDYRQVLKMRISLFEA